MRSSRSAALLLCGLLLIAGCGRNSEPLPAVDLPVPREALGAIATLEPGPRTATEKTLRLSTAITGLERELPLYAVLPDAGEAPAAVLIFSHGFLSEGLKYQHLLRFWASHGYAVLAPTHRDGDGGFMQLTVDTVRLGRMGLIEGRLRDLNAVLDQLDDIEALLGQRFDRARIAMTGHSFGAFSAQQFVGAQAIHDKRDQRLGGDDPRVRAVVAISPPGEMFGVINERSWQELHKPMLITTGTRDTNPLFWPEWEAHLLSFFTAPQGSKYALIIDGADHYLGNLICRPELETPPQHDALLMVQALSTAFLNAYLSRDERSQALLREVYLEQITGGFAELLRR